MTRAVALSPGFDRLPPEITNSTRAVVWNYEERNGKRTKVPYVPHRTADRAKVDDPKTWGLFSDARAAVEDGKADGVGIVLGNGLVGIDLDGCRDPETGEVQPWASEIVDSVNSYTEISPSRSGLHILVHGSLPPGARRKGSIEMYADSRYFTVTGNHLDGTPLTIQDRAERLVRLHADTFTSEPATAPRPIAELDDTALVGRARTARNGPKFSALWDGETSGYPSSSEADLALCAMLAFWTDGDAARIDQLFRRSGLMRSKWDERHGQRTYGELTIARALADRSGRADGYSSRPLTPPQSATTELLVLDPSDPLPSARAFIERAYTVGGVLALRHQSGVFYRFVPSVSGYIECDEGTLRSELYQFLEPAVRPEKQAAFKPTKSRVENVLDALRAICNQPAADQPPCWIQHGCHLDPFDILPCRNGLLRIPTRELLPATPAFFTLNGLRFAYDPDAALPSRWLAFLEELWPGDSQSQHTLQEWIGYLLTPRTAFQKIAMIVGPKRSGKGTIGRIIRRLLGDQNICAPTLGNLVRQFGLSTLIGRSAAIVADARISGRSDTAVIIERLLSISGEDRLSVPRKFLPDWNGTLSTRFLLMTNELPRLEDASGALASRFIVLTLGRSFYGCEDLSLADQLVPELPGILNWALEGHERLYARGRFLQPEAATGLIRQFEDLASPINAFLRDCCEIGPQFEIRQQVLFDAWKRWCAETGRDRPGTIQTFGRDLHAALPTLVTVQHRDDLGVPKRHYNGLRLKE